METVIEVRKSTRLMVAEVLQQKGYLFGDSQGFLEGVGYTADTGKIHILRKSKQDKIKILGIDWSIFGPKNQLYETELICSISSIYWTRNVGGWVISIYGKENVEEAKKITTDIAKAFDVETSSFDFVLSSNKTIVRYVEESSIYRYFE